MIVVLEQFCTLYCPSVLVVMIGDRNGNIGHGMTT